MRAAARSGECVSRAAKRKTRSGPNRAVSRSTRSPNCSSSGACASTGLSGSQRLSDRDGEPDQVEAETWVDRVGEGVQTLPIEAQHGSGVARGTSSLDGDPPDRTIGPKEARLEYPAAFPTAFENVRRLAHQADDGSFDVLGASDRFGKVPLDEAGGEGAARRDADILATEHAL